MSTTPVQGHALGLPAGSVRAVHVLAIVGLVCAMIVIPTHDRIIAMPPYLIYLLFLILGHYFAAHGVSINPPGEENSSPLYLPGWFVRLLIIVPLVGCISWKLFYHEDVLREQFELSVRTLSAQPFLPLVILGGFFAGDIVRHIVGNSRSIAVKSLEAWVSFVALFLIFLASIVHLIIEPSLEQRLYLPTWEGFVGGVVAFYFGERS